MPKEYKLGTILRSKGYTLSCMESLTGGLFAATITSHSGASNYFLGGEVTYANEAKIKAGVSSDIIEKYGAVSSQTAESMAYACQKHFASDVAVSFTGNAGPEAMEGKAVGENYIGIVIKDKLMVFSNRFFGDRNEIRQQCVDFALEMLETLIGEENL